MTEIKWNVTYDVTHVHKTGDMKMTFFQCVLASLNVIDAKSTFPTDSIYICTIISIDMTYQDYLISKSHTRNHQLDSQQT